MKEQIEKYFAEAKPYTRTDLAAHLNCSVKKVDMLLQRFFSKSFLEMKRNAIVKLVRRCRSEYQGLAKELGYSETKSLKRFVKR